MSRSSGATPNEWTPVSKDCPGTSRGPKPNSRSTPTPEVWQQVADLGRPPCRFESDLDRMHSYLRILWSAVAKLQPDLAAEEPDQTSPAAHSVDIDVPLATQVERKARPTHTLTNKMVANIEL